MAHLQGIQARVKGLQRGYRMARVEDGLGVARSPRRSVWADEPSFWFCSLDVRLLILWYLVRLDVLRRRISFWKEGGCSCFLCTSDHRKWHGNSWAGKPIQEKRLLRKMEADAADVAYWMRETGHLSQAELEDWLGFYDEFDPGPEIDPLTAQARGEVEAAYARTPEDRVAWMLAYPLR